MKIDKKNMKLNQLLLSKKIKDLNIDIPCTIKYGVAKYYIEIKPSGGVRG
jgi:hypothetical protein